MDALVEEAKRWGRPRDRAIFLILRLTGMRRGWVAGLGSAPRVWSGWWAWIS
jgi:hypothetical protein